MPTTATRSDSVLEIDARDVAAFDSQLRSETSRLSLAARLAPSRGEAADLARLSEAVDAAAHALFNVLNVASSYCDDAYAERAIRDELEARAERRA